MKTGENIAQPTVKLFEAVDCSLFNNRITDIMSEFRS